MRGLAGILALALGLTCLAPAAAEPRTIGHVVGLAPAVTGAVTKPPGPRQPLRRGDGVVENMEVATGKKAGAQITIEGAKRGAVRLAAETRLIFERWVVNATQGQDLPFLVQVGQILAAVTPHQDERNTIFIDTPTAHIRLEGTLIYVQVAPDGSTSVFVIEGAATVTSAAGGGVHLAAGTRTEVVRGQAPTPPAQADPGTGTLWETAQGRNDSGDGIVDHGIDLRNLQLDLPRLDRP